MPEIDSLTHLKNNYKIHMFKFSTIDNHKKILKSDLLTETEHFFTTRESVITSRDLQELKEKCTENLIAVANYLNIEPKNIISPIQTHSANIAVAHKDQTYPNTDALIVTNSKIAIALNFADCTPIILYDTVNNIGAICHAGWRGTAQAIVPKTIKYLQKNFSTKPQNITAVIGPAISKENYQVASEVFEQVKKTLSKKYNDYYIFDESNNKYNICLKTINCHQLEELGVLRIDMCNYCTYDSVDVFFSYRKEHGKTARHSAILKLIKD